MNLKVKKLLILGGKPISSCDIVTYAKEIGVYTIVTDNLEIENSPAKMIADETWNISTADTATIQTLITKNNVDAVFTGAHEFNIWKTLEVANSCGLPFYCTKQQLELTSIKSQYKKLFNDFGIPVVREFNKDDIKNIEYPVLVKPVDGTGGYGISICNDSEELQFGINHAEDFSVRKEILIEKYINLKEVSIFYIIQNGNIYLSAMADRHTNSFKNGVIPLPIAYHFPSKHLEVFLQKQNQKTINALKSVGLKNGMLFIQSFVDNENFLYYDIGYRLTGTQEYNILEKACGYNPLKMMVDFALTGQMSDFDVKPLVDPFLNGKSACNITFLSYPGKIAKFIGIEEINRYSGVIKTVVNHNVGETIPESALGTLNQVVFRVFGITESRKEFADLIDYVKKRFNVISDKNESLLVPVIGNYS